LIAYTSWAIDLAICLGPALGAHRFVIGRLEPAQHEPTREDQQPQPLSFAFNLVV
jgi:hypothetical protein